MNPTITIGNDTRPLFDNVMRMTTRDATPDEIRNAARFDAILDQQRRIRSSLIMCVVAVVALYVTVGVMLLAMLVAS